MHKKKAKVLVIGNNECNLGEAASGKSSLIQTYVKKNYQFSSDYIMVMDCLLQTQGAEIYSKIIPFSDTNVDVELFLFDLSGHEFY